MATHSGGSTFLGVSDGHVVSLVTDTGEKQWTTPIDGTPFLAVATSGDQLFVPTRDDDVYCLDSSSGTEYWRHEVGASIESPLMASGSDVVFGTADGSVIVLNAANGQVRWTGSLSDSVRTMPAVVGDTVFIRDKDGVVAAFDRATGDEHWRHTYDTGLPIGSFKGPVVRDGRVYVGGSKEDGNADNTLVALDAASGQSVWERDVLGDVLQLVSAPDRLFTLHGHGVYALDPNDGQILWEAPQEERVFIASVTNALYAVGSETVTVLNPADGSVRHRITPGQSLLDSITGDNDRTISTGPIPVPGGILLTDMEGDLWAVSGDGGIGTLEFGAGVGIVGLAAYATYRARRSMRDDVTNAEDASETSLRKR